MATVFMKYDLRDFPLLKSKQDACSMDRPRPLQATLLKPGVRVIMLELYPHLLSHSGYRPEAVSLLEEFSELGFIQAQHVG